MTATSDERRDMARKLRELPIDMYEVEEKWESEGLNTDCHDQTDYYLIYFVLFGCLPADHMHLCDYEELHTRLADLIEPEERTCKVTYEYSGKQFPHCIHVKELSCGHEFRYYEPSYVPNFCPECGAKVVEE